MGLKRSAGLKRKLKNGHNDQRKAACTVEPACTEELPAFKRAKKADGGVPAYLDLHEIVIHDADAPLPCLSLADAPFPAALVTLLRAQPGFTTPSPVQAATWPVAALGRDCLAIAKTGSGKTLGFLLPVLARCVREKKKSNGAPLALIMAPTRELALQIAAEATKFGAAVGCRSVAVYGGAPREAQVRKLQRGCEIIVGTPGRIGDVLDVRGGGGDAVVSCDALCMLVLDEADRMLDMGFEKDIRAICWTAYAEWPRQTFLYSATWPLAVQEVAADLLTKPVKVTVGSGGEKLTASRSVTQRVHVVDASGNARWDVFVRLIAPFGTKGKRAGQRVIVFANMKTTVAELTAYCRAQGMKADSLSGNRSQSQRESTIRKFKSGAVSVVIATDVAARGLDIKGIEQVINYELPMDDFQDYVHRIGRTGRAGATGEADSIFTSGDKVHAPELIRIIKEAGQEPSPALAKFGSSRIVFADSDDDDES
mmetsp:Transcript_39555/g.53747  ORF Transcript_39555/g.53747 Transcript_39555/m.53747 type:complete len:482 (-) Transcript_39555:185-1630(-)